MDKTIEELKLALKRMDDIGLEEGAVSYVERQVRAKIFIESVLEKTVKTLEQLKRLQGRTSNDSSNS